MISFMSKKVELAVGKLKTIGYNVLGEEEGKIHFMCDKGHDATMSVQSVLNKFVMCGKSGNKFCVTCHKNATRIAKYQKLVEQYGFNVSNVDGDVVEYTCKCGEVRKTHTGNLHTTAGKCKKCMNEDSKYSYDQVRKIFNDAGYNLFEDEYKNFDTKMECVCDYCDKPDILTLRQVQKGKTCDHKVKYLKLMRESDKKIIYVKESIMHLIDSGVIDLNAMV